MTTANEKTLAAIDAANGDICKVPLDHDEEVRLVHQEQRIEAGRQLVLDGYQQIGEGLAAIQSGKLYRATHSTFEAYLADRWNLSASRGYQFIEAARVSTIVEMAGLPAPSNESQARELGPLEPDQQVEVYQRAIAETDGKPTAKSIRKARQEVVPRPLPQMGKRNLSIYTDPNNFINVVTHGDDLTRQQLEDLDWERLYRDAVPGYIANVDSTIRLLRKIRSKLTAVTE